jgi:phosphoribosylaminoimidazole-succinocarboxamide synthase
MAAGRGAIVKKKKLLYEGKAKKVYATDVDGVLIQEFKDDATAFDGAKKGQIGQKGVINNQLSAKLFGLLEKHNIRTHFMELVSEREMAIRSLKMFKVEAIVRNVAAGGLVKNYGFTRGQRFERPIFEFHLKDDQYHDPLMNNEQIIAMGLATAEELRVIESRARHVNQVLKEFFENIGIDLVDFKLEFGRSSDGEIYIGDEISPDSCRFWDKATGESVDKDRFRFDMGKVEEAYSDIFQRVMTAN